MHAETNPNQCELSTVKGVVAKTGQKALLRAHTGGEYDPDKPVGSRELLPVPYC